AALARERERDAREHRLAVAHDGARAAVALVAALLAAGEAETVAQRLEQRGAGRDGARARVAVHAQAADPGECAGHRCPFSDAWRARFTPAIEASPPQAVKLATPLPRRQNAA